MNTIVLDRVSSISAHAGIVRIACNAVGADGTLQPSGSLLIPASTAGPVITELVKALQDLAAQQQARLADSAKAAPSS